MSVTQSSSSIVIRQAWGHAAIYAVGSLFLGVGQIAIAPLLISRLSLAEFGTYELFLAMYVAGRAVLLLPLSSAVLYGYCRLCETDTERKRMVGTALQLSACCSVGLCAAGLAMPEWPAWLLRTGGDANAIGRVVVFGLCLEAVVQLGLAILRASQRPAMYGVIALVQLVGTLSLVGVFVGVMHRGVQGVFDAFFLGNVPAAIALVPVLRGQVSVRFNRTYARSLTLLALTVVPVNLALLVIGISDRYFLRYFWDLPTVGVYALSYKLGSAAPQMISMPFLMAWPAFVFAGTSSQRTGQLVSGAAFYLWAVGLLLVVMVSSAATPLILLFGGETFLAGAPLLPIVSIGVLLGGVMNVVMSAVVAAGRFVWNMTALLIVSAVLLVLNVLLIPAYGMTGAAVATLAGYALGAAASVLLARRLVVLDVQAFRWIKVSAGALIALLVGRELDDVSRWPVLSVCVASAVSAGIYAGLLAISGVVPREWWRLAKRVPVGGGPARAGGGRPGGHSSTDGLIGQDGHDGACRGAQHEWCGDRQDRGFPLFAQEPGMPPGGVEIPRYVDRGTLRTYVVEHRPVRPPRAIVVLAGPMSLERSCSYLSWVRWARTLASSGFLVFRFDYAGVGESTGSFAEQTFDTWAEDLTAVVGFAREQHPDVPLFINGLRLGALLGQAVAGCDGLLAWDPPANGRAMLADMLRRKLASDYVERVGGRESHEAYIRKLESGTLLEVEGYPWSRALWLSADRYGFAPGGRFHAIYLDGRPPARLPDSRQAESLRIESPPFWLQPRSLAPDLSVLFQRSVARLEAWL